MTDGVSRGAVERWHSPRRATEWIETDREERDQGLQQTRSLGCGAATSRLDRNRNDDEDREALTSTLRIDQRFGILEVLCGAALLETRNRCLLESLVRAEALRVRPGSNVDGDVS